MSINQQHNLQNQPEYSSFLKNALAFKGSVTPKVIKNVGAMVIYACITSYLCYLFPVLILPIGPFEYGGLILGLVLVFRINAGYDRWWEARKIWGNVVNQSRNLTMIVINYLQIKNQDWLLKITNMIAALPYLMKNNLREQSNFIDITNLLDQELLHNLQLSTNHPLALASIIMHELNIARCDYGLDPFVFLRAQEQLERIMDAQGGCERILKTPMPFVMAVKSRRFILLFLMMLPFALANASLYIVPFIVGLVSYALFSLDQISIELQNPFSDKNLSHLALNDICRTINENIRQIRGF